MLQAIIHRKLDRWLSKDAYSIEDLLTSVVLGSAYYAPHDQALLPFLREAVDEHGKTLAEHLIDVARVTAEFWPNWGATEVEAGEVEAGESSNDTEAVGNGDEDGPGANDAPRPAGIAVARSQPEVVVDITRKDGKRLLILIEAKLHSGKSSHASGEGVTDQLAKYWVHLREVAERRSAEALAVVYLTKGSVRPAEELAASQRELESVLRQRAPLYWLSWRKFADVVDDRSASPILRDCVELLRNRWELVTVRMEPWRPPPRPLPPFVFERCFAWAMPTNLPSPWSFDERRLP